MSLDELGPARSLTAGAARLLADAAGADAFVRARAASIAADLTLPPEYRPSDLIRQKTANLLERMICVVEDGLRLRLPAGLDGDGAPIAWEAIRRSGAIDPSLLAHLVRRVEGDRLAGLVPGVLIEALIGDDDPALADAAMAVLIAEERRRERFADAPLARTDLPADLHHRLVWSVAAALRDPLAEALGRVSEADEALSIAATQLLAEHDESETLEGRAMALARRLAATGRSDDDLLAEAFEQGNFALGCALLAQRAGIAPVDAWDIATDPLGRRLVVALRAIDCARGPLARILVALCGIVDGDPAGLIDAACDLAPAEARAAISTLRLDPVYRQAIDGGGR